MVYPFEKNSEELTAAAALTSLCVGVAPTSRAAPPASSTSWSHKVTAAQEPVVAQQQQPPTLTVAPAPASFNKIRQKEEDNDAVFVIPQRFTKSGRQKAVPFPVKVRSISLSGLCACGSHL